MIKIFHVSLALLYNFSCFFSTQAQVSSRRSGLVDRLKSVAVSLDSADLAGEANVATMRSVLDRKFHVLGIGEQSHGTSEFFAARLGIVKALADDYELTKIGLEAPMAEVEQLNAYLQEGRGDLKEILRSFRLYGYECAEFVNLVENVGRIGKARGRAIRFFGFDMQSPFQSLQNLRDAGVAKDIADSLNVLLQNYGLLNNEIYNHLLSQADFAELNASSDRVLAKLESTAQTKASVRKNIRNYRQFLQLNDPVHAQATAVQSVVRDSLMAENVLAEMEPDSKMVILAHNAHLQRTPNIFSKSIGSFLAQKLGSDYQCIGLTTSYGFYTATNPTAGRITDQNKVVAGDATTCEYHFAKLDQPVFFFKTSRLKKQMQGKSLPRRYRLLVYGFTENQFFDGNLFDDFDGVLHIRHTLGNRSFYLK
ncbi:erythromycin esterase family protein [Dyadobacter sp. MSC1_007]|jgi:erythromycin esterase|uniref:erythromycin esterase family protein n=1 Tax=Dyadobacter sp. MSC1_007 TaxID=2909264 RepID=UPI0020304B23|nr:erythromycin esterase family protein [Dyadobacter sp. MSC1_007]